MYMCGYVLIDSKLTCNFLQPNHDVLLFLWPDNSYRMLSGDKYQTNCCVSFPKEHLIVRVVTYVQ